MSATLSNADPPRAPRSQSQLRSALSQWGINIPETLATGAERAWKVCKTLATYGGLASMGTYVGIPPLVTLGALGLSEFASRHCQDEPRVTSERCSMIEIMASAMKGVARQASQFLYPSAKCTASQSTGASSGG